MIDGVQSVVIGGSQRNRILGFTQDSGPGFIRVFWRRVQTVVPQFVMDIVSVIAICAEVYGDKGA